MFSIPPPSLPDLFLMDVKVCGVIWIFMRSATFDLKILFKDYISYSFSGFHRVNIIRKSISKVILKQFEIMNIDLKSYQNRIWIFFCSFVYGQVQYLIIDFKTELNQFQQFVLRENSASNNMFCTIWLLTIYFYHNSKFFLIIFTIRGNSLRSLPPGIFSDQLNIRVLDLGDNKLQTLAGSKLLFLTQTKYSWIITITILANLL